MAMDTNKISMLMLLDLSAAFYTVHHKLVLSYLHDIAVHWNNDCNPCGPSSSSPVSEYLFLLSKGPHLQSICSSFPKALTSAQRPSPIYISLF